MEGTFFGVGNKDERINNMMQEANENAYGEDVEQMEQEKNKATEYLSGLRDIQLRGVPKMQEFYESLIEGEDEHTDGELDQRMRDICQDAKNFGDIFGQLYDFLKQSTFCGYVDHDIGPFAQVALGRVELVSLSLEKKDVDGIKRNISGFMEPWERCYISLEDVLLRVIEPHKVEDDFVGSLDNGMMERMISFFGDKEMGQMLHDGLRKPSAYDPSGSQYQDVRADMYVPEIADDFFETDLSDREIKGVNGVVLNFMFNCLRNGLKDRMEAENVFLNMKMEGRELVIRIMDDGKGIDTDSLDPSHERFIFREGESGTESTGFGISNFHSRVESMGGRVKVLSYKQEEKTYSGFDSDNQDNNWESDLKEFNGRRDSKRLNPVNTMFEVRLPLIDKK
jgi:hypothetical protein